MNARVVCLAALTALSLAGLGSCGSGATAGPAADSVDAGADTSADPTVDASDSAPIGTATGDVVLLALSDWRGQVDPVRELGADGVPRAFGGLPALTTYFAQEREKSPGALLLASGDSFGSTPLVSSSTDDVLAAKGLSLMGVTAQALGPHDFDRGIAKLTSLLSVGPFRVTSTNLENVVQVLGPRPVTPFLLVDVGATDAGPPVKIAILGLTDWALADLQFASNLDEIAVRAPKDLPGTAAAANEAAANARLIGANLVVALANIGGSVASGPPAGPLIELAQQLRGVDVLIGGETDLAYTTAIGSMLVMQNRNKGRTYGRVELHVANGAPKVVHAEIVEPVAYDVVRPVCDGGATCSCLSPVAQCPDAAHTCNVLTGFCEAEAVTFDKGAQALVRTASDALSPLLDKTIAVATDAFPFDATALETQETALGDLVADAMRARYGAQLAILPGSRLGGGLPSPYKAPADTRRAAPPYDLVLGDVESFVLADGGSAVVRQVTGQALWQILEKSVAAAPAKSDGFLQVSGLSFTYSTSPDAGTRVKTVTLDGGGAISPTDTTTTYTIVMTDAVSAGGLGYGFLAEAVPTLTRELLSDVLTTYLGSKTPVSAPKALTRIVKTN
jgi:5'-nucleotidase